MTNDCQPPTAKFQYYYLG